MYHLDVTLEQAVEALNALRKPCALCHVPFLPSRKNGKRCVRCVDRKKVYNPALNLH